MVKIVLPVSSEGLLPFGPDAVCLRRLWMVFLSVGQSGLGKSTLLNSLFLTDLYVEAAYPPATQRTPSTTSVGHSSVLGHTANRTTRQWLSMIPAGIAIHSVALMPDGLAESLTSFVTHR